MSLNFVRFHCYDCNKDRDILADRCSVVLDMTIGRMLSVLVCPVCKGLHEQVIRLQAAVKMVDLGSDFDVEVPSWH